MSHTRRRAGLSALSLMAVLALVPSAQAQGNAQRPAVAVAPGVPIADLVSLEGDRPVRLVGYGLVTGLSGTGDRVTGGAGARHTVQSVVNLLRNFDIQVPAELLRTRNVAAVLVTAELSPYLRAGGRFDVQVSSVGDAQSLRGGVLWMTPLVAEAGGNPLAVAQGQLLVSEPGGTRNATRQANSGRVVDGGVLEQSRPATERPRDARLLLRRPDIALAQRIAATIKDSTGRDTKIEDPGSVTVDLPRGDDAMAMLARVMELRVPTVTASRLLVDARDGTVVTGGDLAVLDGVMSTDGITLTIGGAASATGSSDGQLPSGARVRDIADALRAVRATPQQATAVFLALRDAGAIRAEVIVR